MDGFNSGNAQTCAYSHDDLARISGVNCGSGKWNQSFSYGSDNFGNVNWSGSGTGSTFGWGYDPATNHFSSTNSPQPVYDRDGNLTYDGAHNYTWDAEGNLSQLDNRAANVYDALGRRVEQTGSSGTNEILYGPDGSKLAVMSGQTVTRAFLALPGGATAVYNSNGLAWYRHPDWLGSSRLASTPTTRTMYYDGAYSPLGEIVAQAGTADRNFTGQNQDLNPGGDLYDFMYREYHASHGRWISPDPAGLGSVDPTNPQSWNRYAYVNNSPLANVDPDGQGILGDIFGTLLTGLRYLMGDWNQMSPPGIENDQFPGLGSPKGPLGGIGIPGGIGGPTLGSVSGEIGGGGGPWGEQFPAPLGGAGGGITVGGIWGSGQIGAGGLVFSAMPAQQIQSWYRVILEHLAKLEQFPNSQARDHWAKEVGDMINNINKKVGQVTKKRGPGADDKYLQRVLGISLQDLQNLLPDVILTIDPCILDPKFYRGCSTQRGPA